jgi:RHS repeat-associated protein
MKNILTSAFFFLAITAFAQDTKKDTTALDYGFRTYDARIGRYMSVDPQASQNNPYQFADTTTNTKQVADTTGWPIEEKNAFIESCILNTKRSMSEDKAKQYCECMLKKVIAKYPKPQEANKLTAEEVKNMAIECVKN